MTLTRRHVLAGAAATVAAAALPEAAVAIPVPGDLVIDMTVSGCRHVLSIPWIVDVAPVDVHAGQVFITKMRRHSQPVWLRVTEEDHAN